MGLKGGVEVLGSGGDCTPVGDGGDPGIDGSEQSDQRGGIDVVGSEVRRPKVTGHGGEPDVEIAEQRLQAWRWVSTKPGITIVSVASTTSASRARSSAADLGDRVVRR